MELEQIYAHYRELVAKYVPVHGYVLKTDCYNEAEGDFKSVDSVLSTLRVTYVEIDAAMIAKARERFPDREIVQGDIRELEFGDGVFSTVVDLSTIDHIPYDDVPKAISEYARVLKQGGKLLMVAWCSNEKRDGFIDWDGPQYFLWEPDLAEWIDGYFITEHVKEFHRSGDVYLVEVVGRKR